MIIVLGDSVLAASFAIQTASAGTGFTVQLLKVTAGGLLILFSMWWLYFDRPATHLRTTRAAFIWGYGHLLLFASVAAVGAGLALAIHETAQHIAIGPAAAGAAIAIPVTVFLLTLWSLHVHRGDPPIRKLGAPITALLVLAASFSPEPPLFIGVVLSVYVTIKVVVRLRADCEVFT
jgi:low temperature requirement protein LtrA